MPDPLAVALALASSYLIGSVDFAVVVARMHGVDIHEVGSGNPGTANVMRTLGKGPAAMVLIGDVLKGVLAVAMGMVVGGDPAGVWALGAGLAAVVGHCFPIFHRFRGGKGVATAVGVMIFSLPLAGLGLVALWVALVVTTRVSAIGSLTLSLAAVPVAAWAGLRGLPLVLVGAIFLLVIVRHHENIRRLVRGREHTVTRS